MNELPHKDTPVWELTPEQQKDRRRYRREREQALRVTRSRNKSQRQIRRESVWKDAV